MSLEYQKRPCGTRTRASNRWTRTELEREALTNHIPTSKKSMDQICLELINVDTLRSRQSHQLGESQPEPPTEQPTKLERNMSGQGREGREERDKLNQLNDQMQRLLSEEKKLLMPILS